MILLSALPFSDSLIHAETFKGKVTAKSGLVLRSKPGIHGNKIIVIKKGEELELTQNDQTKCEIIEDTRGCWLKTKYKGFDGWVFTGFVDLNHMNKAQVITGIFQYALIDEDIAGYIVIKAQGKQYKFIYRNKNEGIQFDELIPIKQNENIDSVKKRSPFFKKRVKITWKKEVFYWESAAQYVSFDVLLKIELAE